MTTKDYIELAKQLEIVRSTYMQEYDIGSPPNHMAELIWGQCVQAVVRACLATSANFNRAKFLTACGVPNALPTKSNKPDF